MYDDIIKRKKKGLTEDEIKHLEEFRKYLREENIKIPYKKKDEEE